MTVSKCNAEIFSRLFECWLLMSFEAIQSVGFVLTMNQGNFEGGPPVDCWGLCEVILIFGVLFAAEIYSRSFQVSASYRLLRCIRGFIKWRSPNACWGLFKTIWMLTFSWLLMLFEAIKSIGFVLTIRTKAISNASLFLSDEVYVRILRYSAFNLLLKIINSRSASN